MEPDKKTADPAGNKEKAQQAVISLEGKIVANPNVSCRTEGDDGALLFNPDTDSTLLINPTGIMVWDFLKEPHTVAEIVGYVSRSYSNSPDHNSVKKDIETFVTDLAPDFISEG